MLKQALTVVALTFVAGAASAGETNPLHPAYQHFAATRNFAATSGNVNLTNNPLQPSYYQWNVAAAANAKAPVIVENNPLQPGYKRS